MVVAVDEERGDDAMDRADVDDEVVVAVELVSVDE